MWVLCFRRAPLFHSVLCCTIGEQSSTAELHGHWLLHAVLQMWFYPKQMRGLYRSWSPCVARWQTQTHQKHTGGTDRMWRNLKVNMMTCLVTQNTSLNLAMTRRCEATGLAISGRGSMNFSGTGSMHTYVTRLHRSGRCCTQLICIVPNSSVIFWFSFLWQCVILFMTWSGQCWLWTQQAAHTRWGVLSSVLDPCKHKARMPIWLIAPEDTCYDGLLNSSPDGL